MLDMKQLLPLLIFINCHMIQVSGVLEWTVTGKVTDYGQNVTLFCHVPNCCPKDAGWDRWTPVQQTLFIDIKTGRPNKKYDGKVLKNGYTLVIQNLKKEDLNVSYSCLYGVTLGQRKFLLEEEVFTDISDTTPTGNSRFSEIQIAGIIIGIVVPVAVAVVFFVLLLLKKRKTNHTGEVDVPLLPKEIPSKDERNTYMDAVQSGTENRQYVRIQVIGKDRVGKTCLVRRLLGKPIVDVKSTDGIDIDKTCQIRAINGEWIVGEVETERMEMIRRLQQAVDIKHEERKPTSQLSSQLEMVSFQDELLEQEQKRNTQKLNLSKDQSTDTKKRQKEPHQPKKHSIKQYKKENEQEPTESDYLIVSPASKRNSVEENVKSVDKGSSSGEKDTPNPNQMKRASSLSLLNQNVETTDKITKAVINEMDAIIVDTKNQKEKMKSEGLVKCGIWDFAGQKDYYATHQTFYTPNAIYLLVADITKDLKSFKQDEELDSTKDITKDINSCKQDMKFDSIEDYIDFWFDCIHCLCEDDLDNADKLCPPVIMVCTGTDKYKKDEDVAKRIESYKNQFQKIFFGQRKVDHSRGIIFFVSNKKKGNEEIKKLRSYISEIAKEMNYFVEKLPTKWIYLENALSVLKGSGINVYEWGNILKLAQKNLIEEDELLLFLKYQHKIGNIIFFDELREYIILQPFWLVQCFRCLVDDCSPEKRKYVLSETARQALKITGELTDKSIDILFKKEATLQFRDHKRHLLNVMEKFDIIVQPEFRDTDNDKLYKSHSYYLPCMIEKSLPFESIKKMFIQENFEVITPWLVLEFKFLPLAYFNHILFYYLRNYTVFKENTTEHPAVYRGKAVFYLDHAKNSMFIICFSRNAISLQIWKRSVDDKDMYERVVNELCDKIENIRGTICQNVSYDIKAKCSSGDFSKPDDRYCFEDLEECDKYFCEKHKKNHEKEGIVNTWLIHGFNRKKKQQAEQEEDKKRREEEELTKAKTETTQNTRDFPMVGDGVIPKHILEQFERRLEQWKKDDQQFVSTEAEKHVMQKVLTQSSVTLIGNSGTGKSFLSKHIALIMKKHGYTVIPYSKPEDIEKWFKHGRKTLFVYDDVCGRYTLNQQIYTEWKQRLDRIISFLEDKCCKIISTCRLEVYKDELFSDLSIFKMCNIDLSSQQFKLSAAEQLALAEMYLKENTDEVKKLSEKFPLLCSLYHKQNLQKNVRISSFFSNPFEVFKDQVVQMYGESDAGKMQYCSLVLCVMFNNTLTEENFSIKDKKIGAVIEDLLEECELNKGTSIKRLKKSLETIEGTYVVKEDTTYKIIHDKLFDFLAKYFGEKMIQIFIDHANTDFITRRFLWKTRDNMDTEIEYVIRIPDKYVNRFINRLLKDWENGYVNNVFQNRNMKCATFTEKFITILNQLDRSKQEELACTQDIHKKDIALVGSCNMGAFELVKWLISRKSDINYCRQDGCFPLLLASQKGHVDVVKELLQHSADVNQCNNDGVSPLYVAGQSGHIDVVKELLQYSADVNKCDVEGKNPLKVAQENCYFEIESLLLKNSANRN